MKKIALLVISVSFVLFSCKDRKKDLLLQIAKFEEKVNNAQQIIPGDTSAIYLSRLYAKYASTYEKDSMAPAYLFKAGEISSGMKNHVNALNYFQKICENYPDFRKTPYAWFFRGFIYENMVLDTSRAGFCYRTFINKYPGHPIRHDVEFALKNMGRSDLDIIHEFEKNQ